MSLILVQWMPMAQYICGIVSCRAVLSVWKIIASFAMPSFITKEH